MYLINLEVIMKKTSIIILTILCFSGILSAAAPVNTLSDIESLTAGAFPRGIAIADINGSGANSLIVANFGAGTLIGQDNTKDPDSSIMVLSGGRRSDLKSGKSPRGLATGDLDGDKIPDIVASNYGDGTVSIITAKGTQTATVHVGSHPVGVAIGDLDGDKKNEIAVAVYSDNKVAILHKDSAGAWQETDVPVAGSPTDVAIGEVGGEMMIVSANYTTADVSIIKYNGSTYAKTADLKTGGGPCKVVIADVTGDRANDIVVSNFYDNTISVITQRGTGAFNDQVVYKLNGLHPNGMAVGDINGDGLNDVVTADRDSDTIDILTQKDGVLNLTLSLTVTGDEKKDFGPVEVAIGDLDGDGRNDIAFTHMRSNTVRVLYQKGTGPGGAPVLGEEISASNVYNYPNPCTDRTTIRYSLAQPCDIKINISDASGKPVWHAVIPASETRVGVNTMDWAAVNDSGVSVANGVYLLKVISGKKVISKKIAVVK
jgi:hypothetical protein